LLQQCVLWLRRMIVCLPCVAQGKERQNEKGGYGVVRALQPVERALNLQRGNL
jgi:hypothetical protein